MTNLSRYHLGAAEREHNTTSQSHYWGGNENEREKCSTYPYIINNSTFLSLPSSVSGKAETEHELRGERSPTP